MRFDCLHCGEPVTAGDAREGDWIECPHCEGEVRVPNASTAMTNRRAGQRRSYDMEPIFVPIVMPAEEESQLDEETRKELEERRRYRSEDREGNPIGITGFAIGLTTFLFLFGGVVLYKVVPAYLWFVAILSVPAALVGLIFSIVGCLLIGRTKLFSLIGAGLGGFLILLGIPIAFLLLKLG